MNIFNDEEIYYKLEFFLLMADRVQSHRMTIKSHSVDKFMLHIAIKWNEFYAFYAFPYAIPQLNCMNFWWNKTKRNKTHFTDTHALGALTFHGAFSFFVEWGTRALNKISNEYSNYMRPNQTKTQFDEYKNQRKMKLNPKIKMSTLSCCLLNERYKTARRLKCEWIEWVKSNYKFCCLYGDVKCCSLKWQSTLVSVFSWVWACVSVCASNFSSFSHISAAANDTAIVVVVVANTNDDLRGIHTHSIACNGTWIFWCSCAVANTQNANKY